MAVCSCSWKKSKNAIYYHTEMNYDVFLDWLEKNCSQNWNGVEKSAHWCRSELPIILSSQMTQGLLVKACWNSRYWTLLVAGDILSQSGHLIGILREKWKNHDAVTCENNCASISLRNRLIALLEIVNVLIFYFFRLHAKKSTLSN